MLRSRNLQFGATHLYRSSSLRRRVDVITQSSITSKINLVGRFSPLRRLLSHCPKPPRPAASTLRATMLSALNSAKRAIHLWGYALAEAIPMTRQKLLLTSPPTGAENSHHCNNTCCRSKKQVTCSNSTAGMRGSGGSGMCTLDPASTRLLLQACDSRQLSLDSVLLASLFLATAEAIRVEKQHAEATKHGGEQHAKGTRAHRGLVLGVICVVMALLSGSIEAKILRYFCCLYAVMTGAGRGFSRHSASLLRMKSKRTDHLSKPHLQNHWHRQTVNFIPLIQRLSILDTVLLTPEYHGSRLKFVRNLKYRKFNFTVDRGTGKEWLNPSRDKKMKASTAEGRWRNPM